MFKQLSPIFAIGLTVIRCQVTELEDRTTNPLFPISHMEQVVRLELPPGNISASSNGRIFFSFFPQGEPEIKVAELQNGQVIPFPDLEFQHNFDSVLSVRVDDKGRLWTLDYGNIIGTGKTKIYGFDITTKQVIHEFEFPKTLAPKDSLFNDMQIDTIRETVFITDTSPIGGDPGLVVYNIQTKTGKRILKGHPSVVGERNQIKVNGQPFQVAGVPIIFNADSIALDKNREWLYFAPFTSGSLFRAKVADLINDSLTPDQLAQKVENFAEKTMSDGISIDTNNGIYITDPEHSAITFLDENKNLKTLFKDTSLRWPDGFSYAPDGYMYLTCSALNDVFLQTKDTIKKRGPYFIHRFQVTTPGIIGR
ncbi:hypothetical protein CH373_05020 [Leptospira perolatii]|uniref:Major royal jelly protein n=1 Tax=Leptospira perolatii TaxID=2023191 RepID=A0A2M9ZQR9_9LEPT|nr:L-dopachrome tautomerase-related protein [Leptospira perolatii]PJZ70437.1 hypothetical protein CH360_05440 [Leptospira perolatii]PJZ74273.1 hypothetical protein CH373_05020 [Leptospira perolatii]